VQETALIFLRLGRPRRSWTGAIGLLLLGGGIAMFAMSHGSDSASETHIRAMLQKWTDDFNAGNSTVVCDLYSQRLTMEFRGVPERNYEKQCSFLKGLFHGGQPSIRYFPTIKDIVARRDYAIVRATWTIATPVPGQADPKISEDASLDVFHLEPDRRWRIVRSLGFDDVGNIVSGQAVR